MVMMGEISGHIWGVLQAIRPPQRGAVMEAELKGRHGSKACVVLKFEDKRGH